MNKLETDLLPPILMRLFHLTKRNRLASNRWVITGERLLTSFHLLAGGLRVDTGFAITLLLGGQHLGIPKVDKSLTRGFAGNVRERQKRDNRINTADLWWAWVDLNDRPHPYQDSMVRFYNNLQDRGDCQTTRKSQKT
jgi:hypothetical protein